LVFLAPVARKEGRRSRGTSALACYPPPGARLFSVWGMDGFKFIKPNCLGWLDVGAWALITAIDVDVIEDIIRHIAAYGVVEDDPDCQR